MTLIRPWWKAKQGWNSSSALWQLLSGACSNIGLVTPGQVYNIVDDDPASRTEVMAYARRLLSGAEASVQDATNAAELEPQPQQVLWPRVLAFSALML